MTAPTPSDTDARLTAALGATYDVVRLLGVGGMGRVYLGHDRTLDRPVAIKVIVDELAANVTFRERFLREARTVARLRHPNIVSVYAAGEADGLLYFVMEYVDGESLRELIGRERVLPAERAVPLLADVARALAYAHAHGVVHRDLKPENVLVEQGSGRAMLTDFGVAHGVAPGDGRMTATGMVVGSPRYMSPEQAVGERDLDGRSDLYALGLVGYELLSGAVAFEGGSAGSMLAKRLTSSPDPILARAPNTPPGVAAAVERAVEREPEARWADGDAMADALEDGLTTAGRTPVSRVLPGARRAPGAFPAAGAAGGGRGRWLPVALAAALVAVVAGLWGLRGGSTGPDRRTVMVLPFELVGNEGDHGWLREGAVSMLTLDLSQWQDLGVIDYERTLDLLRAEGVGDDRRISLTDAQRIAREAGATAVVLGQIQRVGDSLTVTARSYDAATGTREHEFSQAALASADPRPLFDLLARELLQIAGAPELSSTLAQTTTSSLAAYRAYLGGVRSLNRWDTDSAQAYLTRAIELDSTFALAHYKLALALGWGRNPTDTMQIVAARRAVQHASRLRPSDRGLVEAYLPLVLGLDASNVADLPRARQLLDDARRRYADLVSRDSTHAEAWYGLGDANFHYPSADARVNDMRSALRAFDRTLALDSSFHLAYAHKLQIYQSAATRGVPFMLDGDSLLQLTPGSPLAADTARIRAARRLASSLTIREARRWADSDPDAAQAHLAVAQAYATAQDYPAAAAAIRHAMQLPRVRRPDFAYLAATYELMGGRHQGAATTLAAARQAAPAESLVADVGFPGVVALVNASAVPLHGGQLRLMEAMLDDAARVAPPVPFFTAAGFSVSELFRANAAMARAGAGVPWRTARPVVDAMLDRLSRIDAPELTELRSQLPMIAFLLSRDTSYLARLPDASRAQVMAAPSVQAHFALVRGDTAAAERAATAFARGDTLTGRNMGVMALEADVLVALGDLRGAASTYEAMSPRLLSTGSGLFLDPGWAVYARSFADRGAVYEALGDQGAALRAYDEFAARWANADPPLQAQLRLARSRAAALRDPVTTIPVPERPRRQRRP